MIIVLESCEVVTWINWVKQNHRGLLYILVHMAIYELKYVEVYTSHQIFFCGFERAELFAIHPTLLLAWCAWHAKSRNA